LADTGLFVTLAFKDKDFTENAIYDRLLSDKLPANLGFVYENAVAQMLRAAGNELYYHTMQSDTSNHNYEIDFLLSRKDKICPIEVKSSGYRTHASLDRFIEKFSGRIAERYLVYTKDLRKDNDIVMLPMYMTQLL
jgi:predicted AAA+ superfamily ATPase